MWLVAELAVSPFAHALQRMLFAGAAAGDLRDGARRVEPRLLPGVRIVAGGRRSGRRSPHAALLVLLVRVGAERPTRASTATRAAKASSPPRRTRSARIAASKSARSCGGYLKTIDVPELSPFPLLSISDIETTDLDVAAMEHGYARPPLKDFTKKA